MNKTIRRALLSSSLAISAIASPVLAEEKGFYLSIGGGLDSIGEIEGDETVDAVNYNGKIAIDAGFGYGGAIGYDFGAARIEGEIRNSTGDVDSANATGDGVAVTANATGEAEVQSYFFNAYYDFETDTKFTPYVGAGIGKSNVDIENLTINGISIVNGDEDGTAYQFKLGFSYEIAESADIFVEGSYTTIYGIEVMGFDLDDINNWGSTLGVRFKF